MVVNSPFAHLRYEGGAFANSASVVGRRNMPEAGLQIIGLRLSCDE
jgi:hypothetical protein